MWIETVDTSDPRFSVVEAIVRTLGVSLEAFSSTAVATAVPRPRRKRAATEPEEEPEQVAGVGERYNDPS